MRQKFYAVLFLLCILVFPYKTFAYSSLWDAAIARYPIGPLNIPTGNGRSEIDYILSLSGGTYDIVNWFPQLFYDTELEANFWQIDDTVDYLYSAVRNGRGSHKTLFMLVPRLSPSDGVSDRRHDGTTILHDGRQCPNFKYVDIFDTTQVATYYDYFKKFALRYKDHPAVAGFFLGWGFLGENGFDYGGGCGPQDGIYGSRSAGYSANAINQFKMWANTQGLGNYVSSLDPGNIATWGPILPSGQDPQPLIFSQWIRFRAIKVREFQQGMVNAVKSLAPAKPVGLFDYLVWSPHSYARGWVDTPNADFTASQFYIGTQYYNKALQETDNIYITIGPTPPGYDNTTESTAHLTINWDWYKVQMVREIARGAGAIAFYRPEYVQSGLYPKLSDFLTGEYKTLRTQIIQEPTRVALFVPTWSGAAFPWAGPTVPFNMPEPSIEAYDTTYYVNLFDSLGVNYDFVREEDLLDPERVAQRKAKYLVTFIPALRYFVAAIGDTAWNQVDKAGLYGFYARGERISQTAMRNALRERGVPDSSVHILSGDSFDGTREFVGMFNGILYNVTTQPRTVTVQHQGTTRTMTLPPLSYRTPADLSDTTEPQGSYDGAYPNQQCTVYGWTCDPDDLSKSLAVRFMENGLTVGQTIARDNSEQGVIDACGGTNYHRFFYAFPASSPIRDGGNHTITAQAMGVNANSEATSFSPLTPNPGGNFTIHCPIPIPGDLNNDRKVNIADLFSALAQSPLNIFTYNLVVGNYGRQ